MSGVTVANVVVVDASLAATWVLSEPYSQLALALAADWARLGVQPVAPCFMLVEVASAVYKRVRRGELTLPQAQEALDVLLGFGVQLLEEPDLHRRALALAHRFDRPTPYDAHYLALAEMRHCEVWTADERLYNALGRRLPYLRWVATYASAKL